MISRELVEKALSKLSTPIAYEYFFENLKSAEWIKPLKQVRPDIFKKPVKAVKTDQGWSLPWWPESRYLARVADQAPAEIVSIVLALEDTDNSRVHDDFAEAALKIPLKHARRIVPKLLTWFDNEILSFLPEKCADLAAKFAEARDCDMALQLVRKILDLKVVQANADTPTQFRKDRVVTRYFDYQYTEILNNIFPRIVSACGMEAIKVLDEKLIFVLKAEGDYKNIENDLSYIWRPAIEDHGQNSPDSLKDHLINALRNSYDIYLRLHPDKSEVAINDLLQSQNGVHVRLGLYLLSRDTLKTSETLKSNLLQTFFYTNPSTWHEFSHLLNSRLRDLSVQDQNTIFNLIENLNAEKPGDDKSEKHLRNDKYRIYSVISGHLPEKHKAYFESLRAEFGEIQHPDFYSYRPEVYMGPTSPLEESELEKKSPTELINFLKTWEPSKDWFSPSREGLGRALKSLVKKNPDSILSIYKELMGINPTYLRSIIQAFCETDKSLNWDTILELCQWIAMQGVEASEKINEEEDPGFHWARTAVVRLLTKGFENNSLPLGLRSRAWDVLQPITSDPDPDMEHESKYLKGDSDYYQYAINTTRGEALQSVVAYALWLKRQEKIPDTESLFNKAPEVKKVLSDHLDIKIDPQVGMRAVYGRWLPWLTLLDKEWVISNLKKILPSTPEQARYRESAWNTYIVFCGAYQSVFELLSDEYLFEINRIPELKQREGTNQSSDPINRLGEHLMVLYWQGALRDPNNSNHLADFFRLAPIKARENAVNFIGRALKNDDKKEIPPIILERLVKFWNWRKSYDIETTRDELTEFGWWAISGKFEPDWMLSELEWVLRTTDWIEPSSLLLDGIQNYIHTHPKIMLAITHAFIKGPIKTGRAWLNEERFREFLEVLRKNIMPEQKAEFIELIDLLASAGYLEFRPLARF